MWLIQLTDDSLTHTWAYQSNYKHFTNFNFMRQIHHSNDKNGSGPYDMTDGANILGKMLNIEAFFLKLPFSCQHIPL